MTEEKTTIETNDEALEAVRTARRIFRLQGMRPASMRRLGLLLEEAEEIMSGITDELSRRDHSHRLVDLVDGIEQRLAAVEAHLVFA